MNWIYALLLGTVQALTEFLPVSSSGHLVVFQEALRIHEASHAFDALLHLGTALATICFYWKRIWEIVLGSWKWTLNFIRRDGPADEASRDAIELAALIVLCTGITGALAMPLKDVFEGLFENTVAVGIAFLLTGVWLWLTRKYQAASETTGLAKVTLKIAILVAIAQFIAITPGISRSGSTIGMALLLGLQRKKAAEFSFLISIPAIVGANLLLLKDGGLDAGAAAIAAGVISSFVMGLAALWLLVLLVRRGRFYYFSYYLFPLGILVLVGSALGWL